MISIEQWRAVIGSFRAKFGYNYQNEEEVIVTAGARILLLTVLWCSVIVCGVYLYIASLILVCSNDVESNPGPIVYKTCPNCGNTTVHIKKKTCSCGHVFHKKSNILLHNCTTPPTVTIIDTSTNVTVSNTLSAASESTIICTDGASISADNTNDNTMKLDNSNTSDSINDESLQCHRVEDSLVDKNINDNKNVFTKCVVGIEDRLPSEDTIHDNVGVVCTDNSLSDSTVNQDNGNINYVVDTEKDTTHKSKPGSKWDKYKAMINANRRKKYKLDPEFEKSHSCKLYHSNPSPVKWRALESYYAHPSPVKHRALESYYAHPSPVKHRALESYYAHPSPVKCRALESYHAHPSPVKRRALTSYYKDHEGVKKRSREKYNILRQNLIDRHRLQKLVAYSITKKYNKLSNSVRVKTLSYIHKLMNTSELKHLEAKNLVCSCLCYRDIHCKQFITSFKKLRSTILATLVNTLELTEEVETHEMLLGPSMHTPTTEPYFPESCYHSAALDTNGKVILNKFPLFDDSKKGSSKIT